MPAPAIIDGRQLVSPGDSRKPARPKPPNAGKGRVKGVPNKTTALLKDAILRAAEGAGGKAGLIGYLQKQAKKTPARSWRCSEKCCRCRSLAIQTIRACSTTP
jgi:hypothetical protein